MAPQLEEMLNQGIFREEALDLLSKLSKLATAEGAFLSRPEGGWEEGQSLEITKGKAFFRLTAHGPDPLGADAKLERAWGFSIETNLGHKLWLVRCRRGWHAANEATLAQSRGGQVTEFLSKRTGWNEVGDPFEWLKPQIQQILV